MVINSVKKVPQEVTTARLQKQAYKSPLLRVYGAVHQFTQGTRGTASDGSANMTMMDAMA